MSRLYRRRTGVLLQDQGDIDTSGKGNDLPHLSNIRINRNIVDLEQFGLRDAISEQEHRLLWIAAF